MRAAAARGAGREVREVVVKKHEEHVSTTVVDEDQVEDARFTAEEERVLRMRSGASLPDNARLESKLDGVAPDKVSDLAARLLLIEAQALAVISGKDAELDEERKTGIVDALNDLED